MTILIYIVLLKVDRKKYNYIESKTFHESQTDFKHLSDGKILS